MRVTQLGTTVKARRGHGLVEVLTAFGVLVVGMLGFSRALLSSMGSAAMNTEVTLATQAARLQIERLRAADFDTVYAMYNADASDDPLGIVPGSGFDVPGLRAVDGDADGLPGETVFPTVVTFGGDMELREDAVLPALGMPMDMDGDGIDTEDHSDNYRILPVLVRVRWEGENGVGSVELKTVLSGF